MLRHCRHRNLLCSCRMRLYQTLPLVIISSVLSIVVHPLYAQEIPLSSWAEHTPLSPTLSITAESIDILKNGSFEYAADAPDLNAEFQNFGWSMGHFFTGPNPDEDTGSPVLPLFLDEESLQYYTDISPADGAIAAMMGSRTYDIPSQFDVPWGIKRDRIWQNVVLPQGSRATLRFQYQILTDTPCGENFMMLSTRELFQSPITLATYDLCADNITDRWMQAEIDLSAYLGKTFMLQFQSEVHNTYYSVMLLDNASLMVEPLASDPIAGDRRLFLPNVQGPVPAATSVLSCGPTNGSGGRTPGSYLAEVAGLRVHLLVGRNYRPERPTFLAFYLHGDEGNYKFHEIPYIVDVRDRVDDQGWIYVGVEAPLLDGASPPASWHWYDYEEKARRLSLVFDELFAQYNICRNALLGSGASGGSIGFTQAFFPEYIDRYPTFFAANCGGTYPPDDYPPFIFYDQDARLDLFGQHPDIRMRSGIKFIYESDDARGTSGMEAAVPGYASHGFTVETKVYQADTHCDFNIGHETVQYWDSVVKRVER